MATYTFVRRHNEEYGTDGWLLKGAPISYDPIGGMGVAHDILEHRLNDTGSVEDELLALGASFYVRGRGGYWNDTPKSPGFHVSSVISFDLGMKYEGVQLLSPPGKSRPLDNNDYDDVNCWISEALLSAARDLKEQEVRDKDTRQFVSYAEGWLRQGFRRAQRRYREICPESLTYMFKKIEQTADRLLEDDDSLYCPMVVRVIPKKESVSVQLDYAAVEND